ncbi:MAG: YbhB/YbcL family Raf kinase inhibitor-like protein [Candidatus Vogelbacteria bacterium]|nr:YbhB/YbcL family Raf kinase inhibitor-like protein [Candidatus Vogelbacteria bacterium]
MKALFTPNTCCFQSRRVWFWLILLIVIVAVFFFLRPAPPKINPLNPNSMKITSPAFLDGETMPELYTCRSTGSHPPLAWSGAPASAKSLAVIIDDPDAPSGDFVHWVVWNISAGETGITAGALPTGAIEGQNSLGQAGFVAPCPPSGTHHYQFKLYALDTNLALDNTTTKVELVKAMTGHILAETQLVGLVSSVAPSAE